MGTLAMTIAETLRYRGKLGQWSWAFHRIAGLGTLLFLFLHVIDTSWSVFYPELYKEAIAEYQSPLFTLGELALVACVVYHALNGFRIVIFDWKPQWWHYQARAARLVLLGTVVILVPTFALMGGAALAHYQQPGAFDLHLAEIVDTQSRFAVGIMGILILSIAVSAIYGLVPGANVSKKGRASRLDAFLWNFMRVSGVVIIPLVFGHLAMMHIIQGVFEITTKGATPVGTTLTNLTGTAPEFVALRWNTMFAGVFIWRLYDIGLLFLTVLHGFSGLRYVVNDYVHNLIINRGMNIAILVTVVGLLIVGAVAIINTVPVDTVRILEQTVPTIRP